MGPVHPARPRSDALEPDLTLPRLAAALRAIARAAGILPPIVGVLVLVGWAFNIDVLMRVVPGMTAMNPATAVGFICLGAALTILCRTTSRGMRRVAKAFALVPVVLGVSRLIALAGLWDAELDRLLFRGVTATAHFGAPNRMAPNSASSLVLLAVALMRIDRGIARFRWAAQVIAVFAAMTSLLALMGYAYGLPSFYGIGSQTAMALPSAATFLVLSIGVLCARPTLGIMAVISSDSSAGTMVRRLLPAVLVLPAVLGALRAAGTRAMPFETPFGIWLIVVLMMTALAALVGWSAVLLYRSDIDRAAHEQRLAYQATHDHLTRLPNRRLVIEQLRAALDRDAAKGTATAVLFVDLDHFKIINDSLGHAVGDELLVAAGKRIAACVPAETLVGHLNGEEFVVLVPDLTAREPAVDLAAGIRQAFNEPFTVGPHDVFTSVSIGVAFGEAASTPVDLIRHADIAMFLAKSRGRARYEIFDPSMELAARERLRLEMDLRRALSRGELRLYYQPEVEIESGRMVGMEALIRWEHPERGLISPAHFLAVAEETGLIVPIGRWVLREACRQAKEWHTKYRREIALMVSVNLSGKHLQQASLIDEVREVLATTGIDPGHLIIEITETVAMAGAETTIEILTKLKSLGVLLAIDDFGTGFSSLSYLKRFPVDLLKIDKSFVDGVALRGHDTRIVEAIIALGHALGLRVIAEGVETPDQLVELRALGSELGQGFYFGQPMSGEEAQRFTPARGGD
jgi:diguanylate cyclase (GGDEF)-like protein